MKSFLLLFVVVSFTSGQRESRGFFEDATQLWDNLHSELNNFHTKARSEFTKLKPYVDSMERELTPVVDEVRDGINTAVKTISDTVDRVDVDDITETAAGLVPHQIFSQNFNPFEIFRLNRRKAWYEGDNVCTTKSETIDDKKDGSASDGIPLIMMDMTMTSCRDGENFHECTTLVNNMGRKRTIVEKHECCHGYMRSSESIGCTEMILKPLEETISSLEGKEFLELLKQSDMMSLIENEGNLTILMPEDDAIEDFVRDVAILEEVVINNSENEIVYNIDDGLMRKKRDITAEVVKNLPSILKGHIFKGLIDTSDLEDEQMISTLSGNKVRINLYNTFPQQTVMANCAKMVSKNHFATKGVVHILDSVLLPASRTIAELLSEDSQFEDLVLLLEKADLLDTLNQHGQFTIFAPTTNAIESLDDATKMKLVGRNACSKDILKAHILNNVICSGAVSSKAKTVNSANKLLFLHRDEEDDLFVEDSKIITTDIVGTNGVIHVIDKVIIPQSARSLQDTLDDMHSPTFSELVKLSEIQDEDLINSTLFVPSEKAFDNFPKEVLEDMKKDKESLKKFLLYHVAVNKTCQCEFDNKSFKSGLKDKKLRMSMSSVSSPFGILNFRKTNVQCAQVVEADQEMCGSMIHTIDKVLLPPSGNVMSTLKDRGNFENFLELMEFSEFDEAENPDSYMTVLAPNDEAFEHVDEKLKEDLFEDKEMAKKFVLQHILDDMTCCSSIPLSMPLLSQSPKRLSKSGEVVSLRKSAGGHIYADHSEVTHCDILADNGVIHVIDRVLLHPDMDPNEQVERTDIKRSPFHIFSFF